MRLLVELLLTSTSRSSSSLDTCSTTRTPLVEEKGGENGQLFCFVLLNIILDKIIYIKKSYVVLVTHSSIN